MSSASSPSDHSASSVDRRKVLRVGGGALGLLIGIGAGFLDRRSEGGSPATLPAGSTSTSTTIASTTTTHVPLELPDLGVIEPGIVTIGERYLAAHPDEAALARWMEELPGDDPDPVVRAGFIIADEFRQGTTVWLDGWILAVSEARAAAVLALACRDQC